MKRALLTLVSLVALTAPAAAAAGGDVAIRGVEIDEFPHLTMTVVVPQGSRPALVEDGRPAGYVEARELGSAQAMVLAVDNSNSMAGRPLREAKQAAAEFLAGRSTGELGLVAFGHETFALTAPGAPEGDAERELASLEADGETGTALYDAVSLSVDRLERMSDGTRILVLLTDGRDVGSRSSLAEAISDAKRANVIVYAIAVGSRSDDEPLADLASATDGKLFGAADATGLSATYRALGEELDRTWQLSYLSRARPGDRPVLTVHAGGTAATTSLRIPQEQRGGMLDAVPDSVAHSPITAAVVVLLVALLLAGAGAAGRGRRRTAAIGALLEPHVSGRDLAEEAPENRRAGFDSVLDWTESSLDDLPGADRLARTLERSGVKLRRGHLPYLALVSSFVIGGIGSVLGTPPALSLLLMLVGLAAPFVALSIAARRRTQAFDRQLPDVLATIASTLRAGHGLRPALRGIAEDGAPPASEEFARVLGEERLGLPLDQAIDAMCTRIGSPDLEYVATAINVQSQTGGSLAGLFDTLAETVRERQRHARKVRALTALGRISAIVLVGLPIGLAGLMTLISPSYMTPLYTTSAGHVLIVICLTSMAIGSLFLKRIVSVGY
jgi:tight adherence protein B